MSESPHPARLGRIKVCPDIPWRAEVVCLFWPYPFEGWNDTKRPLTLLSSWRHPQIP